ncbi:MAG: fatty acid desaturase, partial [Gammaproteobacteria bacterium]
MTEKFSATNAASSGVTLDRKTIKTLCKRSDQPGLLFLTKWLLSLLASGYLVHLAMESPWLWPTLFIYGSIISLPAYSMSHESAHGTAFRTRWLNELIFWITSLIYLEEPLHRRYTHTNHHTYTWHVGKDSQMPFDTPVTLRVWLLEISGYALTHFHLVTLKRLVLGKYTYVMKWVIPQSEFACIRRNASIFLGIYIAIGIAIVAGANWLLWYLVIPLFLGRITVA